MSSQAIKPSHKFRLTTEEFAEQYLVNPQTVRKRLSRFGSYFGVTPLRLPNRRLLWPTDSLTAALKEGMK